MTTAANATVELSVGQVVGVEFGSRVRAGEPTQAATEVAAVPGATTTPMSGDTASEANSDGGTNWLALGGLLLLVTAVVLLGALVFLVLRGQKAA